MSTLVWLASYPKSGNTWFRMILANLSADAQPADINNPPARGGIASGRREFEDATLLDSGLLTHDEADCLRPRAYEAMARDDWAGAGEAAGPHPRFVKAHDAYLTTPLGEPMFAAAAGVILIVRDPRDVAPSVANHFHKRIDAAIRMMSAPKTALCKGVDGQRNQMRQRLLDWSGHCASWLDQTDVPVRLVRYEDLAADPVAVFGAAMAFAGYVAAEADIVRAVDFARFERLQAQERAQGFKEWRPRAAGDLFFRRGAVGGWRTELTPEQARRIEAAHGPMMTRLGYGLSADQDTAQGEALAEDFG